MSKVSKPALAYASSASAPRSGSMLVPSFSRSATCHRPQINRLISRPSPIVRRSGVSGMGRLVVDWAGRIGGAGPSDEVTRHHTQFPEDAAGAEKQYRAEGD